jgi:hypothetical protein
MLELMLNVWSVYGLHTVNVCSLSCSLPYVIVKFLHSIFSFFLLVNVFTFICRDLPIIVSYCTVRKTSRKVGLVESHETKSRMNFVERCVVSFIDGCHLRLA